MAFERARNYQYRSISVFACWYVVKSKCKKAGVTHATVTAIISPHFCICQIPTEAANATVKTPALTTGKIVSSIEVAHRIGRRSTSGLRLDTSN
jgi:hypothetical protein